MPHEFGRSPGAEAGREPALEDGIGDRLDSSALDFGHAPIPGLVRSDLRRRVTKRERGEKFRALAIKLLGDHSADREPHDRRPPDAEDIEERREIARVVGHVVAIRAGFGKSVAALVVGDDAELGGEDSGDPVPDAQVATERIDEDDRRPVAPALVGIVDDEAVGLHEFHRRRFLGRTAARAGEERKPIADEGERRARQAGASAAESGLAAILPAPLQDFKGLRPRLVPRSRRGRKWSLPGRPFSPAPQWIIHRTQCYLAAGRVRAAACRRQRGRNGTAFGTGRSAAPAPAAVGRRGMRAQTRRS